MIHSNLILNSTSRLNSKIPVQGPTLFDSQSVSLHRRGPPVVRVRGVWVWRENECKILREVKESKSGWDMSKAVD